MPVGLLGAPVVSRPRVALRSGARLAARDDRTPRGRERDPGSLRRRALRDRVCEVPPPLRNAVRRLAEGACRGHRTRLPRGRRRPAARAGERVAGPPRAPARELHDPAPPRRRRAHPRGPPPGSGHRCGCDRRASRRSRGHGWVRAGSRRGAKRSGQCGGDAGQDVDERRAGPLHRAVGRSSSGTAAAWSQAAGSPCSPTTS